MKRKPEMSLGSLQSCAIQRSLLEFFREQKVRVCEGIVLKTVRLLVAVVVTSAFGYSNGYAESAVDNMPLDQFVFEGVPIGTLDGTNDAVTVTTHQDFPIVVFDTVEEKKALLEDLLFYDASYIIANVPAMSLEAAKGIRVGYFINEDAGLVVYRVLYNLSVPETAANYSDIREQFEVFVPMLIADHHSRLSTFDKLRPYATVNAEYLFGHDPEVLYDNSAQLLKNVATREEYLQAAEMLKGIYGKPKSMNYQRSQYYRAFSIVPESYSVMHQVEFESGAVAIVRMTFTDENGMWKVIGFGVQPTRSAGHHPTTTSLLPDLHGVLFGMP